MSYIVLARKYRPQTFAGLTGQEHVSRTLRNAIDSGRVAHAFLFTGARGVGKTSSARILAKALNCREGMNTEPCNVCHICTEITDGTSTDVFEIDGASNTGVDDIRELRENIRYLPSHSRYKIFIIDEVHMLSTSAFNALLKTLEEPPPHVKFIFATTEPHKVPVTILSRCQRFDFKRIPTAKITARLREIAGLEGIDISDSALSMIAKKGDGSMRDSLSAFDQVLAFCGSTVSDEDTSSIIGVVDRRLLLEISSAVFERDIKRVLSGIQQVDIVGYSMRHFCEEMVEHFRNLLIVASVPNPDDLLDLAESETVELKAQAKGRTPRDIERCLGMLLKADAEMAAGSFPRLVLEMALLKMATLEPVIPIQELLEKVRRLETSSLTTPSLPWSTSEPEPRHHSPNAPPEPERARKAQGHSAHVQPHHPSSWERFVEFVRSRKPAVGSLLEHGSPIKMSPSQLHVGFPENSYFLNSMKDADSVADLSSLAREYNSQETEIRIIAIGHGSGLDAPPPSLEEKKKIEREARMEEISRNLNGHPVVKEALRIFGGELTNIVDCRDNSG